MSQGKVEFLKKANIQINKLNTFPTDDALVSTARDILVDNIDTGDAIVDTEMTTEMLDTTLDWYAGDAINDLIVNIHKGDYAIKQKLDDINARLRNLNQFAPISIKAGDITGSAVDWEWINYACEYQGYLVFGYVNYEIRSYNIVNKTWHTSTSNNGGIYNEGLTFLPNIMIEYNGYLVGVGGSGQVISYDGTDWKNPDGTGTGTGPYNDGTALGTAAYVATSYDGTLVIAGQYARIASWDGTAWKNYDGTGTGTGVYNNSALLFNRNDSSIRIEALYSYGQTLIVGSGSGSAIQESGRIASWDGTNWKNYDGTGTGTGIYADETITGANAHSIYEIIEYNGTLVIGTQGGYISSWDGSNWKNYDGTGVGTGIWNNKTAVAQNIQRMFVMSNGNLIVIAFGDIASYDGTAWKNHDGTGTGTGIYYDSINSTYMYNNGYGYSNAIALYDSGNKFYIAGYYGSICSYDITTGWKSWDGTGTGTGVYSFGDGLIETTQEKLVAACIYDNKLVVASETGKISFYDLISETWYGYNSSHPLCRNGFNPDFDNLSNTKINDILVYQGNLLISGGATINLSGFGFIESFDGTAWKYYDGSGTGTGLYHQSILGYYYETSVVYNDTIIICSGTNGYVESFDGTAWKNYNGTGTGTGPFANATSENYFGLQQIYTSYVFNNIVVFAGSGGRVMSWDGTNWKAYDGSGTGTGPYRDSDKGNYNFKNSIIYNGNLIIAGDKYLESYDGTNWRYADGTGTGTGPYCDTTSLMNNLTITSMSVLGNNLIIFGNTYSAYYDGTDWHSYDSSDKFCFNGILLNNVNTSLVYRDALFLIEDGEIIETITENDDGASISIFQNNNYNISTSDFISITMEKDTIGIGSGLSINSMIEYNGYLVFGHISGYITSYHIANKTWHNPESNNGGIVSTTVIGTVNVYSMVVFDNNLIVAGSSGRVGSFDGTNWKNYDGTGTGTGVYNSVILNGQEVDIMVVFNGDLIVAGGSGRVASVTTANVWTDYDGTGGTGIYNNGSATNNTKITSSVVFNGDLILSTTTYGRVASVTAANVWTNYDGTGGGSGLYGNGDIVGSNIYSIGLYSTFLVFSGSGKIASHDGTNWKYPDGTGTGTGPYNDNIVFGGIYSLSEYDGNLILGGSAGYVASYDGTNWKNVDASGSGTGTGPWYSDRLLRSGYLSVTVVLSDQIVFTGSNGLIANYSVTDGWTDYDEPTAGYGIFKEGEYRPSITDSENVLSSCIYDNNIILITISGRVSSYDIINKTWNSYIDEVAPASNKKVVNPFGRELLRATMFADADGVYVLGAYSDTSYTVGIANYSTLNGWTNYDGTGAGIQPYIDLYDAFSWIFSSSVALIKYNGDLIVAGDSGKVGSWDGTDWVKYDGTEAGTGPYNDGTATGSSNVYSMIEYNGNLIVGAASGKIASFDGTAWKNHDGTGTGIGPYHTSGILSDINTMEVYNENLIVAGSGGWIASFDGTEWKEKDGTGTGIGPYNDGTALGHQTINCSAVYNNILIVAGVAGRVASFDGNNWKNYDGTGTGTGVYGDFTYTITTMEVAGSNLYLFGYYETVITIDLLTNASNSTLNKKKVYYK